MDELDHMELDDHEIAGMALATIGVLVEDYCRDGYCDPTMYKVLALAEKLAQKLNEPELATRLAVAKMFAGETVNEMIDAHRLDVDKGAW
jgi:hypothetical protein